MTSDEASATLTGTFAPNMMVQRSTWNAPVTELSFLKVVQYIGVDNKTNDYRTDYAAGHGTHVAGTVAGYTTDAATTLPENLLSDCGTYIELLDCATYFCSSCEFSGYCDKACFSNVSVPGANFSGMAPGAKLMAYDFGDDDGYLDVPDDYYTQLFLPAYDAGAKISTNSWGSSAPFNYYDSSVQALDRFVYEKDDMVILVAAGNEGSSTDDDGACYPSRSCRLQLRISLLTPPLSLSLSFSY